MKAEKSDAEEIQGERARHFTNDIQLFQFIMRFVPLRLGDMV